MTNVTNGESHTPKGSQKKVSHLSHWIPLDIVLNVEFKGIYGLRNKRKLLILGNKPKIYRWICIHCQGVETVKKAVKESWDAGIFMVFLVVDKQKGHESILDIRTPGRTSSFFIYPLQLLISGYTSVLLSYCSY